MLVFVLLLVCCCLRRVGAYLVVVDSDVPDSTPNVNNCIPYSNGNCNLRSAWAYCSTLSSDCEIMLPASAVYIDLTNVGSLVMNGSSHIFLYGKFSSIYSTFVGDVDTASAASFINYLGDPTFLPSLTLRNLTIRDFSSQYAGAVINSFGNIDLSIIDVQFANISGPNGGSIFISNNQLGSLLIDRCFFLDNMAWNTTGGSIHLVHSNNVTIIDTNFSRSQSVTEGASISIDTCTGFVLRNITSNCAAADQTNIFFCGQIRIYHSSHLIIDTLLMTNTYSNTYGGGLYLSQNEYIHMQLIQIDQSMAMFGGGGLAFIDNNHQITMNHSIFQHCFSYYSGGAIAFFTGNQYITLSNILINDATTQSYYDENDAYGGGMYFQTQNSNITLDEVTINIGNADEGGGIYLEQFNHFFSFKNLWISNCVANYADGGGIFLNYNNDHIDFLYVYIIASSANNGGGIGMNANNMHIALNHVQVNLSSAQSNGGGLYLNQYNSWLTFHNVIISGCDASRNGGGIYIGVSNTYIVLLRSQILFNMAYGDGAGIYLNSENSHVNIVGTRIYNNIASFGGGGIYVFNNNPQFSILDEETFAQSTTLQTTHPYASQPPGVNGEQYVIYQKLITFSASCQVTLVFDPQTTINSIADKLFVYGDALQQTVLFESTTNIDFPGTTLPALVVTTDTINLNFFGPDNYVTNPTALSSNFYGFKLYITPVFPNATEVTTIDRNYALNSYGGGLAFYSFLSFPIIANTRIIHNVAFGEGGGLYVRNSINGLTIISVKFENNNSTTGIGGGGICFSTANYGILIQNCRFFQNYVETGYGGGGGVACLMNNGEGSFLYNNYITIQNTEFVNNIVKNGNGGGGIYAQYENQLYINNCIFQGNQLVSSGNGGAIYLEQDRNVLYLFYSQLIGNSAMVGNGGGIALGYTYALILYVSFFNNYAAVAGGGIFIDGAQSLYWGGTMEFSGNSAGYVGGAIALLKSSIWYCTLATNNILIHNNVAERGSAMFFYEVLTDRYNYLEFLTIYDNTANVGGTLYWVYDDIMTIEPYGVDNPSNVWGLNFAPYGNKSATQAIHLLGNNEYVVTVFGTYLSPPLQYQLTDYYHQLLPFENDESTTLTVSLAEQNASCFHIHPYLSGPNTIGIGVPVANKVASFSELQAYCAPNGNMTIKITAHLGSLLPVGILEKVPTSLDITNTTFLQFRSCQAGEYNSNGLCTICQKGSYSLLDNSDSCIDCSRASGVSTCFSNQIFVQPGYWRRYSTTQAVLECPGAETSCPGGNVTGDALCAAGYEGPLCDVCSNGYYRYNSVQCNACSGESIISPTLLAVIVLACFGMLWVAYIYNSALLLVDMNQWIWTQWIVDWSVALYEWWKE